MDAARFDTLARSLAAPRSRRRLLAGSAAAVLGALGLRGAGAQVTQARCGNVVCANNPGRCDDGCVCCGYRNARGKVTNSRCRPPGACAPGDVLCPAGEIPDPVLGCVPACVGGASCDDGNECTTNTCDPLTGCTTTSRTGEACAGGTLTCNAAGECGTCAVAATCTGDGDCAAGEACRNGGCFVFTPEIVLCGQGCVFCVSRRSFEDPSALYCADVVTGIGSCTTTADCPPGTVCDADFASSDGVRPRLCLRACPVRV